MRAAITAIVAGLVFAVPVNDAARARGAGFGGGGAHFSHGFSFAHQRGGFGRFRQPYWWSRYGWWPGYGGYIDVPPYEAAGYGYAPPAFVYVTPNAEVAPSCVRSQETVTVASESGGTRQVSVTRCR